MTLNMLEKDFASHTNYLTTNTQMSNATQQAYNGNGEGQWADRFGAIADIMGDWLQSHLLTASRYRSKVQHGDDSIIAAACTQFSIEKETARAMYEGKCQAKATSWSTTMGEISSRINAATHEPQQARRQIDAQTPPPPNVVNYHDNRQDVRNLTYHAPSNGDAIMSGVPLLEGPQRSIPRRITEFAGQVHPDLQTDEDNKQRQSHSLPWAVEEL